MISNKNTVLWLLLCFPAGLYRMWRFSGWNRFLKMLVSLAVLAVCAVIIAPATQPPERYVGGVQRFTDEDLLIGPKPTEGFERIDLYSYNVTSDSVIAEPEPTPVPVYVYCNDGGKFYHSQECSYVKPTSVRVPLLQALDAGYSQCSDCSAPEEY